MAVPYYKEEYDEPLDENLAAEVGDELATAITTGERFPPQIKRNLDHAIQQCIAVRNMLLDDLEREQAALDTARRRSSRSATGFASRMSVRSTSGRSPSVTNFTTHSASTMRSRRRADSGSKTGE